MFTRANLSVLPLGTRREDILVQATEHIEMGSVCLWDRKRPYHVRTATRRRKGCIAGVATETGYLNRRLWLRVNGPGTVRT